MSRGDLAVIWGGAALVVGLIGWRWSALLTATLNADLAYASGIDPKREQLVLTLALAITVAVAIKVVGVLLIAAMLIIPAAAARPLSRTPEAMALIAAAIGMAFGGGRSAGGLCLRHAGGAVHCLRCGPAFHGVQPRLHSAPRRLTANAGGDHGAMRQRLLFHENVT